MKKKPQILAQFWYMQIRRNWLAYLCGFLFWFPTFQGIFGILGRLPGSDLIGSFYSQQFALQRYGIYFIVLLLLIYVRRFWFTGIWPTLRFILYVLFFPFVVAALVICGVFQVLGLTLFSLSKIQGVFFSTPFFIGSIAAWPLCVYMLQTQTSNLLVPLMVLLGLTSLRLLIEIFTLGAQPLRLMDEILKYLVPWYLAQDTTTVEKLLQLEENQFSRAVREQRGEIVGRKKLKKFLVWYSTHRGTPQFVTSAFVFVFIIAFLLAAFTFAFELSALCRIAAGSLQGLSTHAFWDFMFLSVMWLTTSSPEGVIAATSAARLLVAAETLTGISLLVFLIQCFSVILTRDLEEGRATAEQIVDSV